MADKLWPQGVPNATVPLTTGVKIGGYEPTGTGGTKNVKYDIDEIKEYAEGDLSTDIAQNASDIVDNTSAIGVNSGLINGNTIDISSLEGSRQINLPIGSVILYDGASWVDNVTLEGWYACIAANAGVGCPNLVDKFIKGKAVADSGTTGGANSKTLSLANMPAHNHGAAGSHNHETGFRVRTIGQGEMFAISDKEEAIQQKTWVQSSTEPDHTHNTQGSGSAFDNQPSFYTLIYIRRCS